MQSGKYNENNLKSDINYRCCEYDVHISIWMNMCLWTWSVVDPVPKSTIKIANLKLTIHVTLGPSYDLFVYLLVNRSFFKKFVLSSVTFVGLKCSVWKMVQVWECTSLAIISLKSKFQLSHNVAQVQAKQNCPVPEIMVNPKKSDLLFPQLKVPHRQSRIHLQTINQRHPQTVPQLNGVVLQLSQQVLQLNALTLRLREQIHRPPHFTTRFQLDYPFRLTLFPMWWHFILRFNTISGFWMTWGRRNEKMLRWKS